MPDRNSLVHTGKYWVFRLYVDNDTIGAGAPAGDQYQIQVEHVTVIGDNNYVVRYDRYRLFHFQGDQQHFRMAQCLLVLFTQEGSGCSCCKPEDADSDDEFVGSTR